MVTDGDREKVGVPGHDCAADDDGARSPWFLLDRDYALWYKCKEKCKRTCENGRGCTEECMPLYRWHAGILSMR